VAVSGVLFTLIFLTHFLAHFLAAILPAYLLEAFAIDLIAPTQVIDQTASTSHSAMSCPSCFASSQVLGALPPLYF